MTNKTLRKNVLEVSVEHEPIVKRIEKTEFSWFEKKIISIKNFIKKFISSGKPNLSGTNDEIRRDIYIILRHLPKQRFAIDRHKNKRPIWFSYEKVHSRLIDTIINNSAKFNISLIVLYDGSESELHDDFIYNYPYPESLKIDFQLINGRTALKAGLIMHKFIKDLKIRDEDLIYILENDYMHRDNWLEAISEIYNSSIKFDFITLFDHLGAYNLPRNSKYKSRLYFTKNSVWKTTPGTCFSFIATKKIFNECYDTFLTELLDYKIWTKLLNKRKMVMLSPVPAYSTHCMIDELSPGIDWMVESVQR